MAAIYPPMVNSQLSVLDVVRFPRLLVSMVATFSLAFCFVNFAFLFHLLRNQKMCNSFKPMLVQICKYSCSNKSIEFRVWQLIFSAFQSNLENVFFLLRGVHDCKHFRFLMLRKARRLVFTLLTCILWNKNIFLLVSRPTSSAVCIYQGFRFCFHHFKKM